jgi:hypothetical protein
MTLPPWSIGWMGSVEPSAYRVSPPVRASVVRICSHPKIFGQSSGIDELLNFCDALISQPNARIVIPGDRHWSIFGKLCLDAKATASSAATM